MASLLGGPRGCRDGRTNDVLSVASAIEPQRRQEFDYRVYCRRQPHRFSSHAPSLAKPSVPNQPNRMVYVSQAGKGGREMKVGAEMAGLTSRNESPTCVSRV